MPRFDYGLSKLLGSPFRGGGLKFTRDGNSLLSVHNGRLVHLDLTSNTTHLIPFEATSTITSLAVHTPFALTITSTNTATLLNYRRGVVLGTVQLRGGVVRENAVGFSPCGNMWAVGVGGVLEVWSVLKERVPVFEGMRLLGRWKTGHGGEIRCLRWSGCGTRVVTGGEDFSCRVLYVGEWKEEVGKGGGGVKEMERDEGNDGVDNGGDVGEEGQEEVEEDMEEDLHLDFSRFNVKGPSLSLPPRVLRKPTILYGHRSAISQILFYGNKSLLTVGTDGIVLHWRFRYHKKSGARREGHFVMTEARLLAKHFVRRNDARRLHSAAMSDSLLAVGLSNGVFALYRLDPVDEEDDALFEMRDRPAVKVTDLPLVQALDVSQGPLSHIDLNSSGEWLALGCRLTGQLVVWEWRSETHILKQQGHSLATTSLAFSPDGRAIATGGMDGQVKLWSPNTGLCAATFTDHTSAVTDLTFSAKDVIVSASRDGSVRAFDIRRYRNFRVLVAPPPVRQFGCVAADAAGELIAAGCIDTFEIIVWSLRTGRVLEVLTGHKGPVESLSFRPNRGTLASASWDRTVRLWDMYERKGSSETLEHSKECLAVEYRPDGKEFAVATMSGEIVIWDAEQAVVVGTINGARDAAGGRLRSSRTKALVFGYFKTISYSADGRYLLAGAASKDICIYKTGEGKVLGLVGKYTTTHNQSMDGTAKKISGKRMTEGGVPLELIDEDPSDEEDLREQRIAEAKSVPGALSENLSRRKNLLKVETRAVRFSPTGRSWGAVTTEGILLYSVDAYNGTATVFDPTDLDLEATPEAAMTAAKDRKYLSAILIALRLNETPLLGKVIDFVLMTEISSVVSILSPAYFAPLANFFAERLESDPRIEFNLMWARRLLMSHGAAARMSNVNASASSVAMRALQRASNAHFKRLSAVAESNARTMDYLVSMARHSPPLGSNESEEPEELEALSDSDDR